MYIKINKTPPLDAFFSLCIPLLVGFAGIIFFRVGIDIFKKIKVMDTVRKRCKKGINLSI